MKIWCSRTRKTAIKWRENATKLEPSLHLESCFSGIQLLVVEEPCPLACFAYNIFGVTPDPFKGCQIPLTMIILSGGLGSTIEEVLPVGSCSRLPGVGAGVFLSSIGKG
jgi:hypothetical protein